MSQPMTVHKVHDGDQPGWYLTGVGGAFYALWGPRPGRPYWQALIVDGDEGARRTAHASFPHHALGAVFGPKPTGEMDAADMALFDAAMDWYANEATDEQVGFIHKIHEEADAHAA
jgi:hypothetical protein